MSSSELDFMYLHMVQPPAKVFCGNSDCRTPVNPHSVSKKNESRSDFRTWLSI